MNRRDDERGMTLVEVTVASALALLALVSILQFFQSSVARSVEVQQTTVQQTDVRLAVDRLVRELRQAYTGDPALAPLKAIGPTSITFHSPDGGAQDEMRLRRISYRIQGGRLQRSVRWSRNTDAPWDLPPDDDMVDVLAVQNLQLFTYLDETGTVTAVPAAVRKVRVQVVDVDGHAYRTTVKLRNAR